MNEKTVVHPIAPVFDERSKILILGSFPSVRSRETGFFYGHPQNRFWKVISALFDLSEPQSIEEKKTLLLSKKIALWDVIASCDIVGSMDNAIKNAVPNDISLILNTSGIEKIILNGKTAEKYFKKYIGSSLDIDAVCLPSTSPANAAWSLERLTDEWRAAIFK